MEATADTFHLRALELASRPITDAEGMAGSNSGRNDATPQRNSPSRRKGNEPFTKRRNGNEWRKRRSVAKKLFADGITMTVTAG